MSVHNYKNALITELTKLLSEYEERIRKNQGIDHKQLPASTVIDGVAKAAAIGGVVGTAIPIPGVGNAIGAAAGVALALGVAGIVEAHYHRMNKKLDNAAAVVGFFGSNNHTKDKWIRTISRAVINERKDLLEKIAEPQKAQQPIAAYLAANIMAAIKHDPSSSHKITTVRNGLQESRSNKISDSVIEENGSLSLKDVAQLKR